MNTAEYLVKKLEELGVNEFFGLPGDYNWTTARLWKRPAMPSVWMTSSSAATITEKSNSKRAVLAGSTEEPVSDRPFIFSLAAAR